MESMRDFVTREAGLLHRSICMVNSSGEIDLTDGEAERFASIGRSLADYSDALQLEFEDREMFRWSKAELLRRRALDLQHMQRIINSCVRLSGSRCQSVATCAKQLLDFAHELIALRYKRSAEMRQRVMTLTVSVQLWVLAGSLFFGVLHLETGSSWFNFALCTLTITTISLSLWTIADMDLPFSSSFHRVKFEQLSVTLLTRESSRRSASKSGVLKKALQQGGRKIVALRALTHTSLGGVGERHSIRPAGRAVLWSISNGTCNGARPPTCPVAPTNLPTRRDVQAKVFPAPAPRSDQTQTAGGAEAHIEAAAASTASQE